MRPFTKTSRTELSIHALISSVSVVNSFVSGLWVVNRVWGADSGELLINKDACGKPSDGREIMNVSSRGSKVMVVDSPKSIKSVGSKKRMRFSYLACVQLKRRQHYRMWTV